MSSNKIRSLKLERSSQRIESPTKVQVQDTSLLLAEETRIHVETIEKSSERHESQTPVHSTPKRSSGRSNDVLDHSTLQYRVSPILLPSTQEGVNEVAWDWESPLTKKTKRKRLTNIESTGTPKRTTALQKKRSSNSPLLYKPIKRQLMKNDPQQESLEKFTAEMKALSEQIKTVPRKAQSSTTRADKEEADDDDELLIRIDIDEGETKFAVTTNDENSSRHDVVIGTSLDDFFDDSIDDSMVKCSQEVEEKLKLESCGEKSSNSNSTNGSGSKDSSWRQQSYSRLLAAKDKSGDAAGSSLKVGAGTNSASSSTARRVAAPTSEAKRSSTASTHPKNEAQSTFGATTKLSSSSTAVSASAGNKLNPAPAMGSSTFSLKVPTNSAKSSSFSIKFPTTEAKRSSTVTAMTSATSKSSCFNNNAQETSKQFSDIGASSLDDIYKIPDDSFDDFLAVCFDDVGMPSAVTEASSKRDQDNDQLSSRHGKTYDGPNSTRARGGNLRRREASTARKVSFPPPHQTSSSISTSSSSSSSSLHKGNSNVRRDSSASTVFPRSVSNDNLKPSTSSNASRTTVPQSQSSTVTNQTRKFFKSKSLSTSNFDDEASKSVSNTASSSKGWKSNLFINGNVTSVSTQEKKIHQANACRNNAWPVSNGNMGNTGMYNVNRNGPREDDNIRHKRANGSAKQEGREVATGSQSIQICTPEEIERKRLEAKMKLEAKKKLMARSTSSGILSGGTVKRPIKR